MTRFRTLSTALLLAGPTLGMAAAPAIAATAKHAATAKAPKKAKKAAKTVAKAPATQTKG